MSPRTAETRGRGGILAAALAVVAIVLCAPAVWSQSAGPGARRIVSLVPALTEILFAVGAGPQVVGVSSYDEFPPEVNALSKVGALLNPDTERVLALRPDLVMVYGTQSELQTKLSRAGIDAFSYRHGGIARILQTIRDVGGATGHGSESEQLASALQTRLDAVRARVKDRPRPRTLLVFERQPGTLRGVYVSGGSGFLHEMLEMAGGSNVFADVSREAAQPSIETLLARAPDVILEVRATGLIEKGQGAAREAWSALSSVPAVRNRRVHLLSGDYLVVPGPRIAQATEAFARVLHPDAFE